MATLYLSTTQVKRISIILKRSFFLTNGQIVALSLRSQSATLAINVAKAKYDFYLDL